MEVRIEGGTFTEPLVPKGVQGAVVVGNHFTRSAAIRCKAQDQGSAVPTARSASVRDI
jgi:hypothetical protein